MKKDTKEDFQQFDPRELYKNPRAHMWSPNTYFISVVILVVIIIISLPVFIESIVHWYRFVPPGLLFLSGSVFFFVKSYKGIIKKHVRIFPEGKLSSSNEAGFIGGKSSNFASGCGARIAGGVYAVFGAICLRIAIHFFLRVIHSFS